MPILQKRVNDDFTVVHNAFIRDEKLGINARGLLLTMLSMKDGWNFSIKGLAAILPDGEKRVSTALHSLEHLGYLKRNRLTDKHGKVIEWEYMFSDEPIFLENTENKESDEKEKPHSCFGDVDNGDVGKADVEKRSYNQILYNQIPNNQILSNQSVNLSANPETNLHQKDGQTDGHNSESEKNNKPMPFSQVLEEIGFDTNKIGFVPVSENDLQELDEDDRKTNGCTLPYSLKTDKKAMKEALKILFAYSCYVPTLPDESKRLLDTVISALTTMATQDMQKIQGQTVKYCDVIDRINDIIHSSDSSLMDWFISFECEWKKILSENDIKHQKAYMKSCMWNWLNDYAFEEDNDLRRLDYNFRNGVI